MLSLDCTHFPGHRLFTCRKESSTVPSWSFEQREEAPTAPIKPKLCTGPSPPAACRHWGHCLNSKAQPWWDSLLCQRIFFVNTNTSRRMELLPAQCHVLSRQGMWVQLRAGKRIGKTERTQLLCCILIAIFGKTHVILGLETWIIAQLQWEAEETITMLQYGNILWDKEHSQTLLSPNTEITSF